MQRPSQKVPVSKEELVHLEGEVVLIAKGGNFRVKLENGHEVLAKLAGKTGDTAKLEAAVNAEPANHQARIDYAMALAAGGKKGEALDQLLEAVRRDRKWNEEAARKQLVQLFDAWGPKDPATLEGRRRLSSILFS